MRSTCLSLFDANDDMLPECSCQFFDVIRPPHVQQELRAVSQGLILCRVVLDYRDEGGAGVLVDYINY
jgi:hypothetical protein